MISPLSVKRPVISLIGRLYYNDNVMLFVIPVRAPEWQTMPATLPDVAAAAKKLQDAKKPVSVRAIREVLGGGSPNVLSALLRQWRQAQHLLPSDSEAPPAMIAEVVGAAPRLWALALEEARSHLLGDIDRAKVALQEANAATDEVQGLLDDSVAHLDQARQERQRAIAAAEALQVRLTVADNHLANQVAAATELQAAGKRQQETIDQLVSKLSLSEAAREHDAAQLRGDLASRDRTIGELRIVQSTTEAKLIASTSESAHSLQHSQRLQAQLEAVQLELSAHKESAAATAASQVSIIGGQEKEITLLRSQVAQLVGQVGEMVIARETEARLLADKAGLATQLSDYLQALGPIHGRLEAIERAVTPPSAESPA